MVDDNINAKRRLKRQMRNECDPNLVGCNALMMSNATNSKSPDDMKSRIFIGNLNTNIVTKRHLHLIFIQFGDIKAISMHKGYAFIQYGDEMDALNAVFSQDGQVLAGQTIDVNLVTEPKPHQRASRNVSSSESETSGGPLSSFNIENIDNECFTDKKDSKPNSQDFSEIDFDDFHKEESLETNKMEFNNNNNNNNNDIQLGNQSSESESCFKRVKVDSDNSNETSDISDEKNQELIKNDTDSNSVELSEKSVLHRQTSLNGDSKSIKSMALTASKRQRIEPYSSSIINQNSCQDILICGNCKSLFSSLSCFIQHKRNSRCRLRFVCHCNPLQKAI